MDSHGEGDQWNVHFTNKAYLVKLFTKGGGGQKSPKNGPHDLCTTPYINCFVLFLSLDWNKELITEPRPTMEISDEDLLEIGTGKQKLEDFISRIVCHSVKNEFAVGKKHAKEIHIPLSKYLLALWEKYHIQVFSSKEIH